MNRSWSPQTIEHATGIPATEVARALADRRGTSPALDERVAAAYDRLWDQQPPLATARDRDLANRASALAQRHSWPPPQAYDDDLIDLPAGDAEPGWRRRRGTSHRSADLAEDIAFVREHGGYRQAPMAVVAMRLGVTRDVAEQAQIRARRTGREAEAG